MTPQGAATSAGTSPRGRSPTPWRAFNPLRVGTLETTAWVAYYRRQWLVLLRAAVGLTREAFGLPWGKTLYGAYLVTLANKQWAPADNDPAACRKTMERFYRLVRDHHGESLDTVEAARLEVEWWRIHREHQHAAGSSVSPLIDALAALYAHVYDVPADDVRLAASQRAFAMDLSDRWITEGCHPDSPLIPLERAALIRSFAALLAAVHR